MLLKGRLLREQDVTQAYTNERNQVFYISVLSASENSILKADLCF
jgi:hypothetical protein